MAFDSPPHQSSNSRDLQKLQQQLLISLKFHHRKTLQEMPLELALEAMMQAWHSCHSNNPSKTVK